MNVGVRDSHVIDPAATEEASLLPQHLHSLPDVSGSKVYNFNDLTPEP